MKYRIIIFLCVVVSDLLIAQMPSEKIWLQTNREHYAIGDTIDFEVSVSSTDSVASRVVYVELFSPNHSLLQERTLKVVLGATTHYFVADSGFVDGRYTIRAYTRYLASFGDDFIFKKQIQLAKKQSIIPLLPPLKVAIEGDTLIESLPSRLAIHGRPVQSGQVIDDLQQVFATFVTDSNGLAVVPIVPDKNRVYRLVTTTETITINTAKNSGATMRVDQRDSLVVIKVYTKSINSDSLTLIVLKEGQLIDIQRLATRAVNVYSFSAQKLPQGLLQFLILSNTAQLLTKRLWFNGNLPNQSAKSRYHELGFYLNKPTLPNDYSALVLNHFLILNQLITVPASIQIDDKEQSLSRTAIASDLTEKPAQNTNLMVFSSAKSFGLRTCTTDSMGRFTIENIENEGLIELKIQTVAGQLVAVKWLPREPPIYRSSTDNIQVPTAINTGIDGDAKLLEEVVVKAKYTREKEFEAIRKQIGLTYRPDDSIEGEKLTQFSDITTVLRAQLPGIAFGKSKDGQLRIVYRSSLMNLFVDGTKISSEDQIPATIQIERIEIAKSLASGILMGGSLISILTKAAYRNTSTSKPFEGNTVLRGFDFMKR